MSSMVMIIKYFLKIAINAKEAIKAVELGTAKKGTAEEIKAYLLRDDKP
jgi:hypothetical protein